MKPHVKYNITIEHQIEVPIGTGFGTSAGGALTAGLALKDALDLPLTYNQIGKIAHVSEIKCQTGLGTVSSLTFSGGCVLVVEPGAPGICQIDRIPINIRLQGRSRLFQIKHPKEKHHFHVPEKKTGDKPLRQKNFRSNPFRTKPGEFSGMLLGFLSKSGICNRKYPPIGRISKEGGSGGCSPKHDWRSSARSCT